MSVQEKKEKNIFVAEYLWKNYSIKVIFDVSQV